MVLIYRLQCYLEGKPVELGSLSTSNRDAEILVPLASDVRFMPLMSEMFDVSSFMQEVVIYQVEHDIADDENVIGKIASSYYSRLMTAQANELKTCVALYDFFKQGRYDKKAASMKGILGSLLSGAHALYATPTTPS